MNTTRTRVMALLAAATVILTGCAAQPDSAAGQGTTGAVLTTVAGELSREIFVDVPSLMDNIKQNRGAVVIGTVSSSIEGPGSADPDGTPVAKGREGYQPATDSKITVIEQVAGTTTPESFILHQLLGPDSEYRGLPKLRDGNTYLMVVRPFTFGRPDQDTAQFIVVGFEAAWQQVGSEYEWVNATAETDVKYPARIAEKDVPTVFTTGS